MVQPDVERSKPDDTRLRQYAEQFDMRFEWETKPEPERWWARVTLGHRGSPGICWASPGATEQKGLKAWEIGL